MKKVFLAATCLCTIAVPNFAFAKPEDSAQESANSLAAGGSGIADIVVTAQRRSENLQRAAVAISAVSGDALQQAGVTRPTELTSIIPSLQVAPSAGPYSLFYLRGVGNFAGNALADSAVAFNFDGVFIGRPSSTTGFFYDLERVEVLKGPQGTLYGRNATGGAINVITQKPELGKVAVRANAEYGNYDAVRLDGALNLPIGDSSAVRLSGIYVRHDGYMKDGTDDQNDLGGRLSFMTQPADNLKINVVADYFRQRGNGVGAIISTQNPDDRQGVLSADGFAAYQAQPNTALGNYFSPITLSPYLHNNYWGVSSTIEWQVPVGTITLIPAYRESSLDFATVAPGFTIRQREKDKQTSFEARVNSDDTRPLRYLAGLFYYDESIDVPFYNINQQAGVNEQSYHPRTKSMATFARLTYAITPDIRINAGVRYTTEDKTYSGSLVSASRICLAPSAYFPTYSPGCPTATPFAYGAGPADVTYGFGADGTLTVPGLINQEGVNARRASFERVTYRLGADWDITPSNLLYASYETGFKSGGFFFSADRGVFKPEKIQAWTIGSKNRFFDNRLQINLEGFYWKYRDQQISHLSLDSLGNFIFATENVGRATFRGVEVETQFLATETTLLSADVQFLDAKYNSFVYTTPNLNGGFGNGTSCPNAGTPGVVYTVDCSGRRPPNAPKWTLNLGAQQTINFANEGKVVLNARGHYQSESLVGLEFTPIEYQNAYWMVDGQITYYAPGDRFSIGAFVNNLTDETVKASSNTVPYALFNAITLRPPRTYGVRAGVKF